MTSKHLRVRFNSIEAPAYSPQALARMAARQKLEQAFAHNNGLTKPVTLAPFPWIERADATLARFDARHPNLGRGTR